MARKFLGGKPTVGSTDTPVVLESRTITATSPVTIAGTTSADLSADRTIAVSAASTSAAGVVQLSDSTSTTGSTKAATETAVKSAYDLAAAAVASGGPTTLGTVQDITSAGTYDNFELDATTTFLRASGGIAVTLNGIAAAGPSTPASGRLLFVVNAQGTALVIGHQQSTSTAAYRITGPGQASITLGTNEVALLVYDSAGLRWRMVYAYNSEGDVPSTRSLTASDPLTIGGSSQSQNLSANRTLAIKDATTSQKGAVQLENSVTSSSTTTAAVPNSVRTAYDLAAAAVPSGGPVVVGSRQNYTTSASPTLDDYSLNATTTILRLSGNADYVINGLSAAGATPADGRLLLVVNGQTANNVTLAHAATSSTAAYRITTSGGVNQVLAFAESALLVYDGSSSRWRVASAGAISRSIADTKGDLIVASGADAFTILGVGGNGKYLVADSDATNGVGWGGTYAVTSDVTVANSATFATATGMSVSLAASKVYRIRGAVLFDTTAAGDFKFQFTGPASPTIVRIFCITNLPGATSVASVVQTAFSSSQSLAGTGTTGGAIQFEGVIQTSAGNSGTLAFQFAQNSQQNDTGAIVRAGSYLDVIRVA